MECDCKAQNYSGIRSAVQGLFGLFLSGLCGREVSKKSRHKKAKVRLGNRTLELIRLRQLDFFENQRAVGAAETEGIT